MLYVGIVGDVCLLLWLQWGAVFITTYSMYVLSYWWPCTLQLTKTFGSKRPALPFRIIATCVALEQFCCSLTVLIFLIRVLYIHTHAFVPTCEQCSCWHALVVCWDGPCSRARPVRQPAITCLPRRTLTLLHGQERVWECHIISYCGYQRRNWGIVLFFRVYIAYPKVTIPKVLWGL